MGVENSVVLHTHRDTHSVGWSSMGGLGLVFIY